MLVIKIITNIIWAFRSFVICCPHQQLIELGEEKNFTDLRHFFYFGPVVDMSMQQEDGLCLK